MLNYRLGTVNEKHRGFKPVFRCSKPHTYSTLFGEEYETEEREALRKHGLNEKTAASVLLKLFISGNERCHTTDAP